MPEYLSPVVHVEKLIHDERPIERADTSTAGFVGLAETGPVGGMPRLVTDMAEFRSVYGGYLGEDEFGDCRFLAHAVAHFFQNGGTRAFISRVAPSGQADGVRAADFIGTDGGPGCRTGIQAFLDVDAVSILAVPGITDPEVQQALAAHCEDRGARFAVLDMPREMKEPDELTARRALLDTPSAACYHPWLMALDPESGESVAIPPSGAVMGIYARTDAERGVHKAPANVAVRACTGLDYFYTTAEQDRLTPYGVNLIRSIPKQGILVWGARTASSDPLWRYVSVRRLFLFVEETVKAAIRRMASEPDAEPLPPRARRAAEAFLDGLWRDGALMGASPAEAFYVTASEDGAACDGPVFVIGIAPVRPGEFIPLPITLEYNKGGTCDDRP